MASESETEQHSMNSESEEEVNDDSEVVESDAENETSNTDDDDDEEAESRDSITEKEDDIESEDDNVDTNSDAPSKQNSKSHQKGNQNQTVLTLNEWRKQTLDKFEQLKETVMLVIFPKFIPQLEQENILKQSCSNIKDVHWNQHDPTQCTIEFDNKHSRKKALHIIRNIFVAGRNLFAVIPLWSLLNDTQYDGFKNVRSTLTASATKEFFTDAVDVKMDIPEEDNATKVPKNPFQENGKKGDKRKIEKPFSVGDPLLKRKKLEDNQANGKVKQMEPTKKRRDVEKVKKTTKDLKKKKSVIETEIKQSYQVEQKEIRKKVKKVADEIIKEKKKIKKEKPGKQLKSKISKVK